MAHVGHGQEGKEEDWMGGGGEVGLVGWWTRGGTGCVKVMLDW